MVLEGLGYEIGRGGGEFGGADKGCVVGGEDLRERKRMLDLYVF